MFLLFKKFEKISKINSNLNNALEFELEEYKSITLLLLIVRQLYSENNFKL